MLAKRIIPCLDIDKGRVVKGVNFVNLKDAGDPVENAKVYDEEGADELVFLDITASYEDRKILINLVEKVAEVLSIPFTVGGGIRNIQDIRDILKAGADKVSINTSAVKNPKLITEGAERFGSQCIVVAIDAKRVGNRFEVFIRGGKEPTGIDAIEWARTVEKLGAGEILLTSMDRDGTKLGFDIELTKAVSEVVSIPVIASGGAGSIEHFIELFTETKASAGLAASIFHYKQVSIKNLKQKLYEKNIPIRVDIYYNSL